MTDQQRVAFRIEHKIETWGRALQICRVNRGLSHKDVAYRISGCSKAMVKAWEAGEAYPTPYQLKGLYASIKALKMFEELLPKPVQEQVPAAPEPPPLPPPPASEKAAVEADARVTVEELQQPEAPPKNFGEALRRQRLKEGLDQGDLGDLMGVSQSTISQWERDDVYPVRIHYDELCKLMPPLRDAPLPFSRNISKPVGPLGMKLGVEGLPVPRMIVTTDPPEVREAVARAMAGVGHARVDSEALAYGRALLEVVLARVALAEAQERLQRAETNVAHQEENLKAAAVLAAQEIEDEEPKGGQQP